MTVPLVSIVMAVYNGEPYLAATVESILAQTFQDFEFIVVDDGSKDDTWKILQRFAARDARLVLLQNHPNQGVVRALNRGLEVARGSLIVRQDADDISLPERLEKQVKFLETHPQHGLLGVAVQLVDPAGAALGIGYNPSGNDEIQEKLLDQMCICGPTVAVRRECLQAIGFNFTEGLNASEDYDLCLRLAEVTQLEVLPEVLYLYRQHPASASQMQEQRQAFNKALALERALYRRFGASPPREKFFLAGRDYLRAAILGFLHHDLEAARNSLGRALAVYPPLLDAGQPLEALVRAYTPMQSVDGALDFTESIFTVLLPPAPHLKRLKARLLSYLHMGVVFSAEGPERYPQIDAHLWPGIRYNPAWLLNRGVLVIALRSCLRRFKAGRDA